MFGQICVRIEGLSYNSKSLVRTPGFASAATVFSEEFKIGLTRMAVFLGNRSWQLPSGAITPTFLVVGVRPTN